MRFTKYWKRAAVSASLAALSLLCVSRLHASDVPINPTSAVYPISTSLVWGASGTGAFNNTFFFSPLSPSESVCVYIYNNNTTNAHTFKTSINVTANPSEKTPSDGTWNQAAVTTNMNAPISPGVASNISASVSGAALIAVEFSGASTQAGSPDTASVVVVQTQGSCFSGQNTSSAPSTNAISQEPIQAYSDSLSSGFAGLGMNPSPTGSSTQLVVFNAGAKTDYFSKLILANDSTSAAIFEIGTSTTAGLTCTSTTAYNLKGGSSISSTSTVGYLCGTSPTLGGGIAYVVVPATSTVTVDLSGYITTNGNGFAVYYQGGSVTGTLYASAFWYEK